MKTNRKWIIILMAIALMLTAFSLVACRKDSTATTTTTEDHTHVLVHHAAVAASCESAGNSEYWYCTSCKKYYADEAGETETSLSDVTISATGHTLTGEWIPKSDATCTTAGKVGYRVCPVCECYVDQSGKTIGNSESDLVIAAFGHALTHYESAEATCTETGNEEYWRCSRCEEYFSYISSTLTVIDPEKVVIAALGHTLSHTAEVAATCTEAGHCEYWYCDRCEQCFSDLNGTPYADVGATVIAALGHDYIFTSYVWNTDTAGAYSAQAKLVCAHDATHIRYEDATVTSEITTSPTCTLTGVRSYTATYEDQESENKTETLSANKHTAGNAVRENIVAATCTTDGSYDSVVYCSVCGAEISRTFVKNDALGHTAGSEVRENIVAATCTTDGSYDRVVYCSVCGEELSRTAITIDALGHTAGDAVEENVVAATCTTNGHYDRVVYCSVCGTELSREEETVDALGHLEAVKYENVTENTCTEGGSYDYVIYCSRCEVELSRTSMNVDALGHTAGEAVEENVVPATCTESGSYDSVFYCVVCGEGISREEIVVDALGHDYLVDSFVWDTSEASAYTAQVKLICANDEDHIAYEDAVVTSVITTAPTCTSAGVRTYTATYEQNTETKTETISATGHTAEAAVRENIVVATCSVGGSYDSVVYCSVCEAELSREHLTVNALGHDYVFASYVWNTSVAGAYTAQAKYVCSHDASHVLYEDAEVTSEITTAATCASTGVRTYTATYGDQAAENKTETISNPEHTYTALTAAVAATCTTDGNYAYYYCSTCEGYYDEDGEYLGDSLDDVTISAYGHNYSNMVAAVDATCLATGTRSFCVCSGCQGIFVYENGAYVEVNENDLVIAATGHSYSSVTAAVAATCTEEGSIAYCTCTVCGKYFNEDHEEISVGDIAVAATGHMYVNGVCSVCGAVQGSLTVSTEDGAYSYVKTDGYEVYTVSSAGSYLIGGDAEYAQIYVNAGDDDQVYLYLNGVSITNSADSVVYVNNADKVYLVSVSGTTNTLSDTRSASGTYNNGSACVYSACDLNLTKDNGTLIISSTYKNGIHTKKDLTIKKVNLTVTAVNDALKGEKSIEIGSNATVTAVSSNGDGLKTSDNGLKSSGAQEGIVDIQGGTIYIYANRDGIDSAYDVTISGSTTAVYVYTGDYATTKTGAAAVAGESAKGIKAAGDIYLADAAVVVKAEEDGIHANAGTLESGLETEGNITIYSGTITIGLAKDDGIAADGAITVEDGTVTVDSYDNGVTGNEIAISGGTIIVRSYAGDGVKSSSGDVTVTGGSLTIYAAYDGITAENSVNISDASTNVTIYTSTYSSYTDTSVSSDAYLALTSTSSSYWYAVYFYNSSTDYVWVTPAYKTYESSYYYYKFRSYASDYNYFTVYRFASSVTEPSTSSYSAKSSNLTSSSYFTSSYNALKLSASSSTISVTKTSYSSDSTKGIKSYNEINISGGTIYIKSYDDAIHANNDNGAGTVMISGGTFTLYTMDQGILADYSATISGGTINITYAREGMQAVYLYFRGGTTTIYAYDDGINASKGTTSYTPCIYVYDGATLDITVPSGDTDGIDSNGDYVQTGGTVVTRDATSDTSGNMSGFDIDGTCTITGGIFVCAGTPAELPSSSSQCYVKFSCGSSGMGGGGMSGGGPGGGGRPGSGSSSSSSSSTAYSFASGTWYVKNSSGTTLFSFTLGTTYKGLWMSYSGFVTGSTYTITNGSTSYSWAQSSRATTVS